MKNIFKSKLIMLFMAVIIFTSCGKNNEQANNVDSQESSIVIKAVVKDMLADDPVSIAYLEKVSSIVSEELGKDIKIELVPISDGTYSESMSLLLQSGVIPDLMYFQGGDYQFAITQGILEDLTPYIESSTNVKNLMQPFNEARIENYPYLLWMSPDRIKVPVVRADWFENLKTGEKLLNDPTPENYINFFTELKETNNLSAAYTVPGNLTELDTVFNLAFGVDKSWVEKDGKYINSKVSDGEKEKLAYYADLYSKGLLDNDWLSKKWDTKESAFYNGEVGVVAGTAGAVVNIYNNKMVNQNGEEARLIILPPAKGIAQGYTPSDVSKESRGWAISSQSEYKEETFAILECMASLEGQIFDKLGYEGEQYTVENDVYTLTDKIQEWYPRIHESIKTLDIKFDENTPYFSEAALKSLENIDTYSSLDNSFVLPDEYITYQDAIDSLYLEYVSEVVSGKKSIDTFDEFVESWYSLGGDKITEYANEVLNK